MREVHHMSKRKPHKKIIAEQFGIYVFKILNDTDSVSINKGHLMWWKHFKQGSYREPHINFTVKDQFKDYN